jgi:hypothetical protein
MDQESKYIHIQGNSIYQMWYLGKVSNISGEMHMYMLNKLQDFHLVRISGKHLLSAHENKQEQSRK